MALTVQFRGEHAALPPMQRPGRLSPGQHAVLSLLVCHHKRYADVAMMLGSDPEGIRERAHEALGALIEWDPVGELDAAMMDNALGQLSSLQVSQVASELRRSELYRRLDVRLAVAIDGLRPAQPLPRPRPESARRGQVRSARSQAGHTTALLSLGIGSIVVGAVLFVSGTYGL